MDGRSAAAALKELKAKQASRSNNNASAAPPAAPAGNNNNNGNTINNNGSSELRERTQSDHGVSGVQNSPFVRNDSKSTTPQSKPRPVTMMFPGGYAHVHQANASSSNNSPPPLPPGMTVSSSAGPAQSSNASQLPPPPPLPASQSPSASSSQPAAAGSSSSSPSQSASIRSKSAIFSQPQAQPPLPPQHHQPPKTPSSAQPAQLPPPPPPIVLSEPMPPPPPPPSQPPSELPPPPPPPSQATEHNSQQSQQAQQQEQQQQEQQQEQQQQQQDSVQQLPPPPPPPQAAASPDLLLPPPPADANVLSPTMSATGTRRPLPAVPPSLSSSSSSPSLLQPVSPQPGTGSPASASASHANPNANAASPSSVVSPPAPPPRNNIASRIQELISQKGPPPIARPGDEPPSPAAATAAGNSGSGAPPPLPTRRGPAPAAGGAPPAMPAGPKPAVAGKNDLARFQDDTGRVRRRGSTSRDAQGRPSVTDALDLAGSSPATNGNSDEDSPSNLRETAVHNRLFAQRLESMIGNKGAGGGGSGNLSATRSLPPPGGNRPVLDREVPVPESGASDSGKRVRLRVVIPTDPSEVVWTTPLGIFAQSRAPSQLAGPARKPWEHKVGKEVRALHVVDEQIWVAFSDIKVFCANTNKTLCDLTSRAGKVCSLAEVDNFMITGHLDGKISVYFKKSYRYVDTVQLNAIKPVTSFLVINPGAVWCCFDDGTIFAVAIQPDSGEVTRLGPRNVANPVTCMIVSGMKIWCGTNSTIDIYSTHDAASEAPQRVKAISEACGLGHVSDIVLASPETIVTAHVRCGVIGLWSAREMSVLHLMDLHTINVSRLACSTPNLIWMATTDGQILTFDVLTVKFIKSFSAHNSNVSAIAASHKAVVTGSREGTIRLWVGDLADDWQLRELEKREREYTEYDQLRVFIGSWNVNAQLPTEDLAKWFRVNPAQFRNVRGGGGKAPQDFVPDVFAIGLQEAVELNAQNAISTNEATRLAWEHRVQVALQQIYETDFTCVISKQLVGIVLFIFVRIPVLRDLGDTRVDIVKVGFKGMAGNKGGIAVSMFVRDSVISFVCCHLAAGQKNTDQRNLDQRTVMSNAKFPTKTRLYGQTLSEQDQVFFFGDLNYRIDFSYDECKHLISELNWPKLHEGDQLIRSYSALEDITWKGFHEPWEPDFKPTYKYDIGTDRFDTGPKHRSPAWCDRILYRGNNVIPLFYGCHELLQSDHRPISAVFMVEIKKYSNEDRKRVKREVEDLYMTHPDMKW